ncbi:protease s8 tripeptidyl peptidase [Moniliophthora roreri]|uniref:tripeptidyl-peptidase II n=1 Tax=Moniliophthora roreri TaxID=221103 RepID=A0A0W0GCC4_MONRR|nr:protease s8 tripeptidyl peptidase [Moniliophthora roreri]
MVRISCALAILAVMASAVSASVTPRQKAMSVLEQRPLPAGFARMSTATKLVAGNEDQLNLRVALKPKDRDGLVKTLYETSTPGSASYGQHLSREEVKAFMAPDAEAVSAVARWLSENGVTDIKPSGAFDDWLSFSVPASKADSLFNAKFEKFQHISTGEQIVRTLEYSVPQELLGHISLVHPTTSFALRPPAEPRFIAPVVTETNVTARANPAPTSCNNNVTPTCLQQLYGIPTTPASASSPTLGVTGFIQQWAQEADLSTFLSILRPDIDRNTSFTLQTFDGGENPQGSQFAGIEANLDIQYTVGIATGVPVTFLSVGLDNSDDVSGFLDVYEQLTASENPPPVLSTSYGFDEPDLGPALANRLCDAYAALAARGVSNLYASGDGGVWGSRDNQCTTFVPTFPAGCPFVTAVGSTSGGAAAGEEVASDFSSGGFSDVFARPSYQDAAVSLYISAIGDENAGLYNTSSRGYPDVSARGTPVQIVNAGQRILVQGTSCSCPIFASVIALINDQLVAAGKPVLGFLNPFLYANPDALFDTTKGTNNGPDCQSKGFPAVKGWDASTGLGTPNYEALLAAALAA